VLRGRKLAPNERLMRVRPRLCQMGLAIAARSREPSALPPRRQRRVRWPQRVVTVAVPHDGVGGIGGSAHMAANVIEVRLLISTLCARGSASAGTQAHQGATAASNEHKTRGIDTLAPSSTTHDDQQRHAVETLLGATKRSARDGNCFLAQLRRRRLPGMPLSTPPRISPLSVTNCHSRHELFATRCGLYQRRIGFPGARPAGTYPGLLAAPA
jgi:hypothetical protein